MGLSYLYGKRFVASPTPLTLHLREELYPQPYDEIDWSGARYRCAKEDLYYPQSSLQDLFWKSVHIVSEHVLNRWSFKKLIRQKALKTTMELIHYHDQATRYITGGYVQKPFHMLACWVDDPDGDYFKRHLARVPDYIWVGEDGLKIQSFGSQLWDAALSLEALLDADLADEIKPTLVKGYDFLKKSQLTENPPGDHRKMFRDITKGGWTFSDQDQGWPVSDCVAESLTVDLLMSNSLVKKWIQRGYMTLLIYFSIGSAKVEE